MKIVNVILALTIALSALAALPHTAHADNDYTLVLTHSARLRQAHPTGIYYNQSLNYLNNASTGANRFILRLPHQSVNGTITDIKLRFRVLANTVEDAGGLRIYAYRALNGQLPLDEVSWKYWKTDPVALEWYYPGGDYTTQNQANYLIPTDLSAPYWVEIDVTDQTLWNWDQSQDHFVLIKFQYENQPSGDNSQLEIAGVTHATTSIRPRIVITYEDPVPDPTVAMVPRDGLATDITFTADIYPYLQDQAEGDIYLEWSPWASGSFNYSTTPETIYTNDYYPHVMTGLTADTEYEVRAVLEVGAATYYSSTYKATTLLYETPEVSEPTVTTWNWGSVSLNVTYNTREAPHAYLSVQHRYPGGSWLSTTSVYVTDSGTENFLIPQGDNLEARGVLTYAGRYYYSTILEASRSDHPTIYTAIDAKSLNSITIETDVVMNDAATADIYCELRRGTTGNAIYTSGPETLTTDDTLYHTFANLDPKVLYQYRAYYTIGDNTKYYPWTDVWTSDIIVHPTVEIQTTVHDGQFTITLSAYVHLQDAVGYDTYLRFAIRPATGGDWTYTPIQAIPESGQYTQDILVGTTVLAGQDYQIRAQLSYTEGLVFSSIISLNIPLTTAVGASILSVDNITNTSARINFYVYDTATQPYVATLDIWIYHTIHGLVPSHPSFLQPWPTLSVPITRNGFHSVTVKDLDPDSTYLIVAKLDPRGTFASEKHFSTTDVAPTPDRDWWSIFPWLPTGVKWPGNLSLIFSLVIALLLGGLVQWKLRDHGGGLMAILTVTACMIVFGIVGWMPPWIILMLALPLTLGTLYVIKGRQPI